MPEESPQPPLTETIRSNERLTRIENKTDNILLQLIQLNGKVAKHDEYINEDKLNNREQKGFREGRGSIQKRDIAIVGGILVVIQMMVPVILPWIQSFSGGK